MACCQNGRKQTKSNLFIRELCVISNKKHSNITTGRTVPSPHKKIIYLPFIITNTIKPFKNEEGEQKTRENGERECLCYLRFSERHISPAGFAKIRIFCYLQRKNRLKQR